jgi:hypothetical protein
LRGPLQFANRLLLDLDVAFRFVVVSAVDPAAASPEVSRLKALSLCVSWGLPQSMLGQLYRYPLKKRFRRALWLAKQA